MNLTLLAIGLLGLCAGVLSGLFGIGGGVLIVIGLTSVFGLDQKTATGTSLAALVPPVGLLACFEYYRRGEIKMDWAALLALGLAIGAVLGAKLMAPMSPLLAKRLFGAFLMLMGLKNIFL